MLRHSRWFAEQKHGFAYGLPLLEALRSQPRPARRMGRLDPALPYGIAPDAVLREHPPHYAKFGQKVTTIRRMVEDCRRLGYSYNPGHFINGVSGLGVPAYDSRGRLIGVINVTAISERLTAASRRREIVAFLRKELATVRL